MTSGIRHKFTKEEFIEAIKSSKNHREARSKLGYTNTGAPKNRGQYGKFLELYKPDTSHFSLQSRSLVATANGTRNNELTLESIYNRFLSQCKHHNINVKLTFEEFVTIVRKNCFYCGDEPKEVRRHNKVSDKFKVNGIDRIDSSKPYIKDNVRPCCSMCNYMKQEYSDNEFFEKIRKIYQCHLI